MPLQVGTMMVVVRAQDFASRTLRRVGTELEGLSRAQALQMRGQQIRYQKGLAESQVRVAEANMKALRTVDAYNTALAKQGRLAKELASAEAMLNKQRAVGIGQVRQFKDYSAMPHGVTNLQRAKNIRAAQQELAMAMQEYSFYKNIRDVASRKVVSPAARVAGMQQAATRMSKAQDMLAKSTRSLVAGQSLVDLETQVGNLRNRYNQTVQTVSRYQSQIARMPGWLRAAATSQVGYANAVEKANSDLARAYYNLDRVSKAQLAWNNAMRQLPAQRLADLGHALSGIGRTMQLVGLVGTGIMGAAANSFAKFNQQVMLAATQTGPIGAGYRVIANNARLLGDRIMALSQEFPATAEEMAKAAYDIYSSMDVSFNGGIVLLQKFNKLSVATLTDLETATNAGITVLNNFGGSAQNIDKALNLMVSTVRFGRMRLEDFNSMLNMVAPAAANAGNTLRDVAGAMALITTRQPSQRQGATGIARLFQVFMNPEFQEGIRQASKGVVDIVKAGGGLKPLPVIVNDIAKAFKEVSTKKGAAELFRQLTAAGRGAGRGTQSTIFAQRAWTFLFKNLDAYNNLQQKVTKNNKELARAFKVMAESPGVRWQVMINQLRVLVLLVGEAAIPIFLKIGDAIKRFVTWFRNLSDSTRSVIGSWTTWISVGTLLTGVILGVIGPLLAMIAHFQIWKQGLGGAEKRVLTFSAALRAIPLVAFTVILAQFVGIGRALRIMILGWIAWKVAAIAAAAAVAAANVGAAATVKMAWRRALASTGVGLLVVAFGLAAEYVITHWEKVKRWFSDFWTWLAITADEATLALLQPFSRLPDDLGQWARDIKNDILTELGGLKMAKTIRDENAQTAREMDKFLKDQPKKFRAARKSLIKEMKALPKDSMLRAALKDQIDTYNDALKRWRESSKKGADTFSEDVKKALKKAGLEDYSKMLDQLSEQAQESGISWKDWSKQLAETTKQAKDSVIGNLRQMYQTMLSENEQAFGQLFKGPWLTSETFNLASEWGIMPGINDLIIDLKQQNAQFARWRSSLDKLVGKGLPPGFIDELRAMGPEEGQTIIDNILGANPKKVQQLINEWKKKNKVIQEATKMDFSNEIKQFQIAGVKMGDAIVDGFKSAEVAVWFDKWVKATFPNVIQQAVNQAVNEWKKANPAPIKPGGDRKDVDKNKRITGNQTNTSVRTNDNSKTANVTINLRHDNPRERNFAAEEEVRKVAFVAQNIVRGWL